MNSNILLNNNSIIYVLCPANLKTGGTELLHQLVNGLNQIHRIAYITYYFEGKRSSFKDPTPTDFTKYIQEYRLVKDIEDEQDNLLVIPEICVGKHRKYKLIQKALWWLSVDNYIRSKGMLNRLIRYGVASWFKHVLLNDYAKERDITSFDLHLVQSHYAYSYVISIGIEKEKTVFLSDYINDIFFGNHPITDRKDVVLFNPKKGRTFTNKIIQMAPDVLFRPIDNMESRDVFELMWSSKVYIDFGNHPGKDRIPRESAMCGCCVITNTRGAANNHMDVPIPDECKFKEDEDELQRIVNKIRKCISDYPSEVSQFDEYRSIIKKEKASFYKSLEEIFV
ncbi:MAG: hypothetical protein IKO16_05965 [Lachnospiraceae bacterium]|nr:hypothetical protein [Lachnospiraceae bacterium]